MTDQTPPEEPSKARLPARRLALSVGIVVVVLIAIGVLGRIQADRAAEQTVDIAAMTPRVDVAIAKREDGPLTVSLPGQTQSFDSASIYARATGYVAERLVDIGSRVRKGDLLVRIAAPDTDAQLAQAEAMVDQLEATLVQARSSLKSADDNRRLADVTSHRTTALAVDGWATKQNADNDAANQYVQHSSVTSAEAGIGVAQANLRAQQATVDRLRALVGFERVVAPFDGVITSRAVDIGDLLQADSTSAATPMFSEASDDVLRADVYVPQSEAVGVRDGLPAKVAVPEMPGRVFAALVTRNAVAVSSDSRSMLTEIDIANRQHVLRPGLYVNISFDVPRPHPVVAVPDAALIFNSDGLQVATVSDGRAHMRPVTIEHDLGTIAELSDGLRGGERVIISPPSDLVDGQKVDAPPEQATKEAASGKMPPA